ncbi:MAG: SMP-30/gluconolactonase/LRE family protein [Zavarzinella sp.]
MRLFSVGMMTAACVAALAATPTLAAEKVPSIGKIIVVDDSFKELLAPGAVIELLEANKFEWSEGPVWDAPNKRVLFSDIPRNMIWSWSEKDGLKEFLKSSGYTGKAPFTGREPGSNGLAFNAKGELLMCMHGDRRVAKYVDGKFVTLADKYMGKRLNSPNDLTIKSNGDIYFTDPPYGLPKIMQDPAKELDFQGVYLLREGKEPILLTKEVTRPNGIALSPDEKTLYVASSDPDKAIWMSYPVKDDGTIGAGKLIHDATKEFKAGDPGLPDGMKVDNKGNIWATGPGGVWVFNATGKHIGTVYTGEKTANCGWGNDGSVLYLTADKNLCRIRTTVKGKGWK